MKLNKLKKKIEKHVEQVKTKENRWMYVSHIERGRIKSCFVVKTIWILNFLFVPYVLKDNTQFQTHGNMWEQWRTNFWINHYVKLCESSLIWVAAESLNKKLKWLLLLIKTEQNTYSLESLCKCLLICGVVEFLWYQEHVSIKEYMPGYFNLVAVAATEDRWSCAVVQFMSSVADML